MTLWKNNNNTIVVIVKMFTITTVVDLIVIVSNRIKVMLSREIDMMRVSDINEW